MSTSIAEDRTFEKRHDRRDHVFCQNNRTASTNAILARKRASLCRISAQESCRSAGRSKKNWLEDVELTRSPPLGACQPEGQATSQQLRWLVAPCPLLGRIKEIDLDNTARDCLCPYVPCHANCNILSWTLLAKLGLRLCLSALRAE